MQRMVWSMIGLLSLIAIVGCDRGPVKHKVNGQVWLDGEPVTEGQMTFRSKDPNVPLPPEGATIANGKYEVAMVAGTYFVTIRVPKKVPLLPGDDRAYPDEKEKIVNQTEHYNETNPLTADVSGSATIDFKHLKSKKD